MGSFTDARENAILEAEFGVSAHVAPTGPFKLALTTTAPTDAAAGTKVTGGGYTDPSITWGSAAAGVIANTNAITISNMPAVTVLGFDVYDSAGSPRRIAWGTVSKTYTAGDAATIAVGALTVTLD